MDRGCGRDDLLRLDTPRVKTLFGRATRVEGALQLFERIGEGRRPKRHDLGPGLLFVGVARAQGAVGWRCGAGEDIEGGCGL